MFVPEEKLRSSSKSKSRCPPLSSVDGYVETKLGCLRGDMGFNMSRTILLWSPILIALLACLSFSRRAVPTPIYSVTVPAAYDTDEGSYRDIDNNEHKFSPREIYLQWHRFGWDRAQESCTGVGPRRMKVKGTLNPVGQQAIYDGRQQFFAELNWLWQPH